MIHKKTILGIIPARSGSKGLPKKNIIPLCGKPLIAWTIEVAKKSAYLDEILVSTDSKEIASIANKYGASVPFLRPNALSTDTSPTIDTVEHAIDYYKKNDQRTFDYVCLLEPTSPIRKTTDIDAMLDRLFQPTLTCDSIISVGETLCHPSWLKKIQNSRLIPYNHLGSTGRRQSLSPVYFPFGVAYITKTNTLLKEKTFYTSNTTYFLIDRYQCYEIDDKEDLICVEAIMKYRGHCIE